MTTASLQLCEPIEMTSTPGLAGFAGVYERHYEAVFRAALRITGRAAGLISISNGSASKPTPPTRCTIS